MDTKFPTVKQGIFSIAWKLFCPLSGSLNNNLLQLQQDGRLPTPRKVTRRQKRSLNKPLVDRSPFGPSQVGTAYDPILKRENSIKEIYLFRRRIKIGFCDIKYP